MGKNKGDNVLVNKYAAVTSGGAALTEGTDITATGVVLSQATVTLTELPKLLSINGANSVDTPSGQYRASRADCERPLGRVWRSRLNKYNAFKCPADLWSDDMTRAS